jgi:hypothetical protein
MASAMSTILGQLAPKTKIRKQLEIFYRIKRGTKLILRKNAPALRGIQQGPTRSLRACVRIAGSQMAWQGCAVVCANLRLH